MVKKKTNSQQFDLFAWAESQPESKPEGGQVIRTEAFKYRMIANGIRHDAVRKGKWPLRALHREVPGEIVPMQKHA